MADVLATAQPSGQEGSDARRRQQKDDRQGQTEDVAMLHHLPCPLKVVGANVVGDLHGEAHASRTA